MTRSRSRSSAPKFAGLNALQKDIEKNFGEGTFGVASKAARAVTHIETDVMPLDMALHGGIPEYSVSTLVGWEGSGKSTIASRIAAAAQRKYPNKSVLYLDAENTFDMLWGEKHGMREDQTFLARPPQAQQLIDIMDGAMKTNEVSLVILDSIPAMVPANMADQSSYDVTVGARAQLVGVMCSKIQHNISTAIAQKEPITVIFINQWRDVIGGFGRGPTKKMPGGNQPRYIASTIIDLYNNEKVAQSEDEIMSNVVEGHHSFRIKKSKVGNSIRSGDFVMVRDPSDPRGDASIDDYLTTMTYAKKFGLWSGGGSKWQMEGVPVLDEYTFKKRDHCIEHLRQNPDEYTLLKRAVMMLHRKRAGLKELPKDGYLFGWT